MPIRSHAYSRGREAALRPGFSRTWTASVPVPSIASRYEAAVRAGEQRLAEEGLDPLSAGKDCFKLARNDVVALDFRKDLYGLPRLVLRTTRGRIRFRFPNHAMEQVQVLVEALQRR